VWFFNMMLLPPGRFRVKPDGTADQEFFMIVRMCVALFLCALAVLPARAQVKPSECLAIAMGAARLQQAALQPDEVSISYAGHSTFVIESPGGVRAATDFNGAAAGILPDVVTMNRAHSSHYTDFPDPAIKHVLRGWGETPDKPADHDVTVADMRIRNVATDIRRMGGREANGNSIFIFEAGGLCIGHLGHLHHELTPAHKGWIGRLDVVMVPVDGGMTLPVENMMAVLKDLNVRVILPMHARFAGSLERFLGAARTTFRIERLGENTMVASVAMLPDQPTVYVMPGM
jgi:L-ascorbate metabolism protein UlaG (beta-lactamase superfamily)